MKNQQGRQTINFDAFLRRSRAFLDRARWAFFAGILLANTIIASVQPTLAAQTATQYCNQYTTNTLKNACKAGVQGEEDCGDYALIADQSVADICTKAAKDRASGLVTKGDVTVTPSPSPSPSTEPDDEESEVDPTELQGLLDQAQSLSDYIDILHGAGPDADVNTDEIPDDTPGQYVNGAGGKQKIEVTPCKSSGGSGGAGQVTRHATNVNGYKEVTEEVSGGGGGSCPAILFFNGGGWHSNDQTDDKVVEEGSIMDRGYTVMDVSYRYGSSGVYYIFEDVMRAIQHVRNNADAYGIDPNKIAIWGDSAGGSLTMRAAASGRSGAKAAVGWSAPTNAYTALFKSFQSFAIGMDHSTCIPTDLAGFANFADLMNGGSGSVAEYGQGLSSNDFSALGIDMGGSGSSASNINPLSLLTQGLVAGQNLLSVAEDVEGISSQISGGMNSGSGSGGGLGGLSGMSGMSGSVFNLASKKFVECLDNFNVLSPALFASPDSAPSFLAGFETDGLIDPQQAYDMRDKLRQLGIHSDALILPESQECLNETPAPAGAGGCHLGYFKDFVCETLNFIDSEIQPDKGVTDCSTNVAENQGSDDAAAGGGGGGDGEGEGEGDGNGGGSQGEGSTGCPAGYLNAGGTDGPNGSTTRCVDENTGCPAGYLNAGGTDGPNGSTTRCVSSAQEKCEQGGGRYLGTTGTATNVCRYGSSNTQKPAEQRPNCTGESYYSTTHKSCVYTTRYTEFGSDNQFGRSHGCGSARYIAKDSGGNSVCGVGANAF